MESSSYLGELERVPVTVTQAEIDDMEKRVAVGTSYDELVEVYGELKAARAVLSSSFLEQILVARGDI